MPKLASTLNANGVKVINLADPTADQDGATKAYVDAVAQGLDIKESVVVATVAALEANTAGTDAGRDILTCDTNNALNDDTIDGFATLVLGDRILVKDEASLDNGLYEVDDLGVDGVSPWILKRTLDLPNGDNAASSFVFVQQGSTNADSGWVCTNDAGSDVVGTDTLLFTQFTGAGAIVAGDGLDKTGNTLSVNVDDTTIEITTDTLNVKDLGISTGKLADDAVTAAKLAADTAGDGLVQNGGSGALDVNVDGTTIEITGDQLNVVAGAFLTKYTDTNPVGFGPHTINHALNTVDVAVTVRETATGDEVLATVSVTDANNVTVDFTGLGAPPAAGFYTITVMG